MTTDSDILRRLIVCAFDGENPRDLDLSLSACLDLYGLLLLEEVDSADTSPLMVPHRSDEDREDGAEAQISTKPAGSSMSVGFSAKQSAASAAAAFKKVTHARLRAFRERRGLGCFVDLAADCGNGIDEITLSRMHSGERFPIETWRAVAAALDKHECEES